MLLLGWRAGFSHLPPAVPCLLQRRVKAPGAFGDEGAEQLEEGQRREAQAHLRALMAAWQRVLPEFFPQMAEDVVTGALGCHYRQRCWLHCWPAGSRHRRVPELINDSPSSPPTPHPPPSPPPFLFADVINVRSTRVVLITDRHVAYLRARHMRRHSIYKAKWLVPIAEMQNLSGGWVRG